MSGDSTFILNSSASPARSFALSLDPCAYDTLLDTFGLGLTTSTPEARASPNGEEEERESDPPAAVDDAREDDGLAPIERDRLERMRRNGDEMRRMGIVDSVYRLAGGAVGKPKAPEQKTEPGDDVIIIDDEDEEEDDDVNVEEATRDETGLGYGCKRCRFSKRGCYDSADGKGKGCRGDATLGPLSLQRESGAPKKRKGIAREHNANPIMSPRSKRRRSAPAKYESGAATEAERRSPTVIPARKHAPRPDDEKKKDKKNKKKLSSVPGYPGISVSNYTGRFCATIGSGSKPNRLYLGTVDTLKEAKELYNEEARKRGKPVYRLLEAPKINKISTAVPGLPNINLFTADGKFVMQFTHSAGSVHLRADTLDEAVKAYNEERVEHRLSTHKITAEHRAVVEEMQRRRKLFVAERSKHRESTPPMPAPAAAPVTRACSKVPAPPPKPGKTRPARATAPPTPKPGRDARESAPTPNPEPVERGAAAAGAAAEAAGAAAAPAPVTPAPPADSADVRRLREQIIELQDMNRSLLGIAQRAMSMAAKNAEMMS
ncbi:predicted protein [Micromonas commoda]|uniref:Uncharacterized protein n=1 Tax=Micromonas commoda (strain RCC299 / NOUM17 / CCMP2709) TaxID=296587 RepID=C1FID2_MICCC|nr:predicted protein [Micromonas commoda]ACO69700.1 predicted protein [Micromonas commoda]|eukprot:XP_002508442.1 predicted protein [Micromonas commoda]